MLSISRRYIGCSSTGVFVRFFLPLSQFFRMIEKVVQCAGHEEDRHTGRNGSRSPRTFHVRLAPPACPPLELRPLRDHQEHTVGDTRLQRLSVALCQQRFSNMPHDVLMYRKRHHVDFRLTTPRINLLCWIECVFLDCPARHKNGHLAIDSSSCDHSRDPESL